MILLNKPLSESCDEQLQTHREEMAITLLKHSGTLLHHNVVILLATMIKVMYVCSCAQQA